MRDSNKYFTWHLVLVDGFEVYTDTETDEHPRDETDNWYIDCYTRWNKQEWYRLSSYKVNIKYIVRANIIHYED